ncbi:putative Glycogen synthase [Spironucleus salmonicida]|uniref:Glycogen [starch] synthase n=1 Tax=Spironucleus salmonicida TaxID=348837 RepID=V6LTE3_9EUKA|nr:putative Glycogen synthase [Spironucleus salmonicida]|eukprot:EST44059.1 Glycogen synthase [Spironucleus salmonicida]
MSQFILEASYEVIHKVGGVETVVRSKAPELVKKYGDHFFMIGMNVIGDDKYATNFEDKRTPNSFWDDFLSNFERSFELPLNSVRYGQWLIPGGPQCFLLPLIGGKLVNVVKTLLWEESNLSEQPHQHPEDFKLNAITFGAMQWAFYSFFLVEYAKNHETIIVQTHEWLAGVGLFAYKKLGPAQKYFRQKSPEDFDRVKFIFTTHATTLGRHLSAGDADLNQCFKQTDAGVWDAEACKRSVEFEHRIERACANLADQFTTVSTITSVECEAFLGRKVDAVTWNGLHVDSQKGLIDDHELNFKHKIERDKILEFVKSHFYGIDIDNTFVFFSAGRYEYKNKGYDLFIDALYEVNKKLTSQQYRDSHPELANKFVVGIIIAPAPNNGFTEHSLFVTNLMKEIQSSVGKISENITESLGNKLCECLDSDFSELSLNQLCGSDDLMLLKRFHQSMQKSANQSPVTTHKLADQNSDLLCRLRELHLTNNFSDRCKMVWVPEFLSKTSIFGLDYSDFTRGAHLGVFASLYEPFGYTSPECMCVGTASVVSNMCGFGNYIEEQGAQYPTQENENNSWMSNKYGVQVVDRIYKPYWDTVLQLHEMMLDYLKMSVHQRIALRNRMSRNSIVVDWSIMIKEYIKVYDQYK